MTTAPAPEPAEEIIPRPEMNFAALRVALARVAPARMAEFLADRDVLFNQATAEQSFSPIRGFLIKWATEIEILRVPALAQRMNHAQREIHTLDRDDPAWRAAMGEALAVHNEAETAVTGG
ncbi:hypothetical protein [Streptomyces albireticuli]|uniref:Uncharacterized protein n=1 Tax=Streptomyces albireticuli TaxID=1940 RepID=A0A2A2CZ65_9ACTN|nr:hypothetical protein [Streptomyces albireticuli]MCD9141988.1 hypothetical protein [Streptomyces albireticuli]MCD9163068.1 hypothetical protein [Streptomyces albireticuli]MCD9190162.1 hypothetical protein [Streptomyces albireticuli]PAU44507.1 hypothetical protein CK936_34535 [Streptomyces albireticuli]